MVEVTAIEVVAASEVVTISVVVITAEVVVIVGEGRAVEDKSSVVDGISEDV